MLLLAPFGRSAAISHWGQPKKVSDSTHDNFGGTKEIQEGHLDPVYME